MKTTSYAMIDGTTFVNSTITLREQTTNPHRPRYEVRVVQNSTGDLAASKRFHKLDEATAAYNQSCDCARALYVNRAI
jgi:hypothetical protein